jgi:hypothetical protein
MIMKKSSLRNAKNLKKILNEAAINPKQQVGAIKIILDGVNESKGKDGINYLINRAKEYISEGHLSMIIDKNFSLYKEKMLNAITLLGLAILYEQYPNSIEW